MINASADLSVDGDERISGVTLLMPPAPLQIGPSRGSIAGGQPQLGAGGAAAMHDQPRLLVVIGGTQLVSDVYSQYT